MSNLQSEGWDWGEYRMVDPRLVITDHSFQREHKKSIIEAIAASPNTKAFGVPVVFERNNGMLYCADGQQRIQGILECESPPRRIPVLVFPVQNSVADEAEVFYLINVYRKGLSSYEKHRGGTIAEHPANLGIERVVESVGLSIGQSRSPKTIGSIAALHEIWNRSGEEVLKDTLVLGPNAWPDDPLAFDSFILRGLAEAVAVAHAEGKYDRQKMQAALARTSPARILRQAEEIRFNQGSSKMRSVHRALQVTLKAR